MVEYGSCLYSCVCSAYALHYYNRCYGRCIYGSSTIYGACPFLPVCGGWYTSCYSSGFLCSSSAGGCTLECIPYSFLCLYCCIFVRLFIIRSMIHLSLYSYFHAVLLRCLYVLLLAMPLPIGLLYIFPATLWAGISVCFVSVLTISLSSYRVGLAEGERKFIKEKIRMFLSKSN